ncbi:hypothetical protein [Salipiger marinus]|uniref:hypothetical protein n=1 Tax=Salipiger marinus TaxID=555512 RepID=UPI001041E5D2|nr:hypothetical protein [Salipiger marinus]
MLKLTVAGATVATAFFAISILWVGSGIVRLGDEITLGIDQEWETVCLTSQYEIPDIALDRVLGMQCWDGLEAPQNTIFVTYSQPGGTCVLQKAQGQFLTDGNSETRCYSRSDVEGSRLVKTNGVFEFEE